MYAPEQLQEAIRVLIERYPQQNRNSQYQDALHDLKSLLHEAIDLSNPLMVSQLLYTITLSPPEIFNVFFERFPDLISEAQVIANVRIFEMEQTPPASKEKIAEYLVIMLLALYPTNN